MSAPAFRSAVELRADFSAGRAGPVEVMEGVLGRIAALNDGLNAYYALNEDARNAAAEAERALRTGDPVGPLHGIAISVKDLIATAGVRTTRGSAIFADSGRSRSRPTLRARPACRRPTAASSA